METATFRFADSAQFHNDMVKTCTPCTCASSLTDEVSDAGLLLAGQIPEVLPSVHMLAQSLHPLGMFRSSRVVLVAVVFSR